MRERTAGRRRGGERTLHGAASSLLSLLPVAESVLVIADRIEIATMIARCLTGIGLRPLVANDMRRAGLLLQRETPAAVVLDLTTPGHCDAVMHWLRRDASRAAVMVVQVSALARNGGAPRGELRADVRVPKPFTPRQIVDGVRSALARRSARQRFVTVPARRAASIVPQGTSIVPQGTSIVPQGASIVPQGTSIVPQGTSIVPQGASIAPHAS